MNLSPFPHSLSISSSFPHSLSISSQPSSKVTASFATLSMGSFQTATIDPEYHVKLFLIMEFVLNRIQFKISQNVCQMLGLDRSSSRNPEVLLAQIVLLSCDLLDEDDSYGVYVHQAVVGGSFSIETLLNNFEIEHDVVFWLKY